MNNPIVDILLYIITFTVIGWLFVKTRSDFKRLTSPDRKNDTIINPRSFVWRGGLFVFAALFMIQSANNNNLLPIILFICLFALGIWNIYHAILYRNWKKQKSIN